MATSTKKKSSAVESAKMRLKETHAKFMAHKKEAKTKLDGLKSELKTKTEEARQSAYLKGWTDATNAIEKKLAAKEKIMSAAIAKFEKQFKISSPVKKKATKKAPAKKATVAKKAASPKKATAAKKATAPKKVVAAKKATTAKKVAPKKAASAKKRGRPAKKSA